MTIACLIHDDAVYANVRGLLQQDGSTCDRFQDEASMLRALCRTSAELVIVDTGLDLTMHERILSWLSCRTGETTPVLMLSLRNCAELTARALDAGAADVLARPFESLELRARVRAALRRHRRVAQAPTLTAGGYELDRNNSTVSLGGQPVELTAREFAMAWLFFSNPNDCLSRETISLSVWAADADITARTIEQHVYKLRKKLQLDGKTGVTLRTCYSQGYKLEVTRLQPVASPAPVPAPLRHPRTPAPVVLPRTPMQGLSSLPSGFFSAGLADAGGV